MGQKVHPTGIRLGIVKDHTSVWFADKKHYAEYLLNDLEVRQYLRERLADASVGRIEIARPSNLDAPNGGVSQSLTKILANF